MSDNESTPIHIFIDTSVFIRNNFYFKGRRFSQLIKLIRDKVVVLHSTQITNCEVISNICSLSKEAESALNNCSQKAKILKNIDGFDILLNRTNFQNIFDELVANFDEFLKRADANIISTSNVSIDTIFENYFKPSPPFAIGKKKYEFPDAFVLEALATWCKINNKKMIIISQDKDMASYCNNSSESLSCMETLDELLDAVSKKNDSHDLLLSLLDEHKDEITDKLERDLESFSFTLSDYDGDIDQITVNSTDDIDSFLIQEITSSTALISFNALVNLSVSGQYDDYENSPYDNEDKEYVFVNKEHFCVEKDIAIPIMLSISYSNDKNDVFEINKLIINDNVDISINLDDSDDYGGHC